MAGRAVDSEAAGAAEQPGGSGSASGSGLAGGSGLARLAAAYGVATWYEDTDRRRIDVEPAAVVAVLGALGVAADTPAAIQRSLAAVPRPELPATVVVRQGQPHPLPGTGTLTLEDGAELAVDGALPADLPLGYHRLRLRDGATAFVIVTPARLPEPPTTWGYMVQLYALRSTASWGVGDLADLAAFTRWASAGAGAGAVLLNPLHAVTPLHPVPASPYYPSSRRAVNPVYLRPQATDEYRLASDEVRRAVDALQPPNDPDLIDYDAAWRAKRQAFELLWPIARAAGRPATDDGPGGVPTGPSDEPGGGPAEPGDGPAGPGDEPAEASDEPGGGPAGPSGGPAADVAAFFALAELHGPRWQEWPAELRRPDSSAVAAARAELADRIAFHTWLQRVAEGQLAAAGQAADGMAVGIVHDLAVGIDPSGADGWLLQDVLAPGASIGAPPDAFNQLGQDWGLAPWRPDRLAATGYRAYRDVVRSALREAGGIRVDHVAGLWRLWWVPAGRSASQGTYVYYDADAMVGVLALEAYRAGAVVIGEDLGTVEPEVTEELGARAALGCAVLWFQRDATEGSPFRRPEKWLERTVGSISTHDLPTAAGFLSGEHVRTRARLGLLRDVEAERKHAAGERENLVALLVAEGVAKPGATEEELIEAMHALLGRTRSRILLVSPYDVLGELRQPNLPGTVEEYPNWRLPLPVTLDELCADPRMARIAELMRQARG